MTIFSTFLGMKLIISEKSLQTRILIFIEIVFILYGNEQQLQRNNKKLLHELDNDYCKLCRDMVLQLAKLLHLLYS